MQFEVEAAGIAHRLPVGVTPPQRRRARVTVGTYSSCTLADNLKHNTKQQTNLPGRTASIMRAQSLNKRV